MSEADRPEGESAEASGRDDGGTDGGTEGARPAESEPVGRDRLGGRERQRNVAIGVAVFIAVAAATALWIASRSDSGLEYPPLRRNADAYRGLGVWIDVHDDALLDDPRGTVDTVLQRDVRTIYLETSNYGRSEDIYRPGAQAEIIDAAHEHGIDVVAWYLPGLDDIKRDLRRSLAAIDFETPRGERFDGFAMDIESTVVRKIGDRNRSLGRLTQRLRDAVGNDYTLGGIIPSPVGLATPFTGYWPNFPYEMVATYYDVMLPMSYSSYRAHGMTETHDYIAECFKILRQETGDASIPVHVIGGIARSYTQKETQGFINAAREYGALGASIYDLASTNPDSWPALADAPMNPPQWPAMPVQLGSAYAEEPMGNIPRGDRSHPKEVFFATGSVRGSPTVSFELLGSSEERIQVSVNGRDVADVQPSPPAADTWGPRQEVSVPRRLWNESGENVIRFMAPGAWPLWSTWGVRAVELGG